MLNGNLDLCLSSQQNLKGFASQSARQPDRNAREKMEKMKVRPEETECPEALLTSPSWAVSLGLRSQSILPLKEVSIFNATIEHP